jgi:hypothetical protein
MHMHTKHTAFSKLKAAAKTVRMTVSLNRAFGGNTKPPQLFGIDDDGKAPCDLEGDDDGEEDLGVSWS